MNLSRQEAADRYKAGNLKIALLGMSNIGKSHFAKRLHKKFGFSCTEVDAVIQSHLGKDNMNDHAAWLGQPYSQGYAERESEAIDLETRATSAAIDLCLANGNAVLDAPGSVIYVDEPVIERLKSNFWLIYLEASHRDIRRLKQLYYTSPKPLIWNDSYNASLAKTPDAAVMASYEGLLAKRADRYSKLANITLPAQQLFTNKIDLAEKLGLSA
jgi:shikimate kinase